MAELGGGVVPPLCSRKPLYPGVWFVLHIASQVVLWGFIEILSLAVSLGVVRRAVT